MFYKNEMPNTWKELQEVVAEYFEELGFIAHTPFKCNNDSISFEIDVYAEKELNGIPIKVLIECKYWDSKVIQDVVFSMITRVDKYGANLGIIISKNGFQEGAILSTRNTNILLYTYQELLTHFKNEWIDIQLSSVYKRLSFFNMIKWICYLDREETKGEGSIFFEEYGYLYMIYSNMSSGFSTSHKNYTDEEFLNHFPKVVILPNGDEYKVNVLGDAFRLLLKTNYLDQVEAMLL